MKLVRLFLMLVVALSASHAWGEDYRNTITIYVENKSALPNRVQVRDVEARYGIPEDCRIAKKIAPLCSGDPKKELKPPPRDTKMTCAAALALMEEPRCSIKDLIFDDWIDGGMKVELKVHTDAEGFGLIAVRAVNNTEDWTFKPGLQDGDTVGHQ